MPGAKDIAFLQLKEFNTVVPLWGGEGLKQRIHWSEMKETYHLGKVELTLESKIRDWHPEQITNIDTVVMQGAEARCINVQLYTKHVVLAPDL